MAWRHQAVVPDGDRVDSGHRAAGKRGPYGLMRYAVAGKPVPALRADLRKADNQVTEIDP
jgi:hypothetical protein